MAPVAMAAHWNPSMRRTRRRSLARDLQGAPTFAFGPLQQPDRLLWANSLRYFNTEEWPLPSSHKHVKVAHQSSVASLPESLFLVRQPPKLTRSLLLAKRALSHKYIVFARRSLHVFRISSFHAIPSSLTFKLRTPWVNFLFPGYHPLSTTYLHILYIWSGLDMLTCW